MFGRKKPSRSTVNAALALWTNAPATWPRPTWNPPPSLEPAMLEEHLASTVETALRSAPNLGARVIATKSSRLFPEGVLPVHIVVQEANGAIREVVIYALSDTDNSGDYSGTMSAYKAARLAPPIYYSVTRILESARPVNPFLPFHLGFLRPIPAEAARGDYAMWWATPEDAAFGASPARAQLDRIFQALDGYETAFFADVVAGYGLADLGGAARATLPREPITLPLVGPDGQTMVLSVDTEKGIRIHFNTKTCSARFRTVFLKLFADFALTETARYRSMGMLPDPPSQRAGQGWWSMLARHAGARPAGPDTTHQVGLLRL